MPSRAPISGALTSRSGVDAAIDSASPRPSVVRPPSRTSQVPLMFVTAGAREQQRRFAGCDAAAVDFLFKPVEPWLLESKVQVFIQLYRSRQQAAALARELQQAQQALRALQPPQKHTTSQDTAS